MSRSTAAAWLTMLAVMAIVLIWPGPTASVAQAMSPPCPSEDGGPVIPCRWDARTMGNRQGSTVYLIIDEGDGVRVLLGQP